MDDEYQPMFKQAQDLQYKIHDALDNPHHPAAIALRSEAIKLQSDLELRRNPRDIETRINAMQHTLSEARNQPKPYMSFDHINDFHGHLQQMRENVRKFSDYQ